MSTKSKKSKNEITIKKPAGLHPKVQEQIKGLSAQEIQKKKIKAFLDFSPGLIVGSYSDQKSFYWGVAANANKELVAGHGLNGNKPKGSKKYVFEQDNPHYVFNILCDHMFEHQRVPDGLFCNPTISNTFTVNKEQMTELNIESMDGIRQLSYFAANCYRAAPHVIEQMREGKFDIFKKYQETEKAIEVAQKNNSTKKIVLQSINKDFQDADIILEAVRKNHPKKEIVLQ